jgi:hypothetical protein
MTGRESGMPDEAYWETLFDLEAVLDLLASNSPVSGKRLLHNSPISRITD